MSVAGEKFKDNSEGCAASTSGGSKQPKAGVPATDNTGSREPSVNTPATLKAQTNTTKQKKSTRDKGKESSKAKFNRSAQEGAVQKRLDHLESMLEKLISNMYYEDGSDTTGHVTVPCREHENNEEGEVFDPQQADTATDSVDNDNISTKTAGSDTHKPMGFALKFAGPSDEGAPLDSELAGSVNFLLTNKLEEKQLTETGQKYLRPSNCDFLVVPKVNPVIWEHLTPGTRSNDARLQRCQKPLLKGLTAWLASLKDRQGLITESEQDGIALLCNANFELNALRKELIKPELNKRYSHLCKPTVTPTQWLFGDDLQKTVKELDEQQKAVGAIRQQRPRFGFHPYRANTEFSDSRRRFADAGWVRRGGANSRSFLGPRRQLPNPPGRQTYKQAKQMNAGKQPRRV
ncbi:hypothetical protein HOLleu_13311 [Holothuria leucospilota]|uniref:Uncharacterized protein n=1 Tax=Holothuria leucospilota TaxID=206669 RepID=A0A9Q1CCC6_HOLLE|nr:hypothetical protein HOLleu_13311 [Holothuria leucospilota]